jgi:hypothetical protein
MTGEQILPGNRCCVLAIPLQMTVQPSHSIMLKLFATSVHEMIRLQTLSSPVAPPAVFDDNNKWWGPPCLVVCRSEQSYTLDRKVEHLHYGDRRASDQEREAREDDEAGHHKGVSRRQGGLTSKRSAFFVHCMICLLA